MANEAAIARQAGAGGVEHGADLAGIGTELADAGARLDPRQVVVSTLTVLSVAACFGALYALRGALFLLFAALVIGTAARPAVKQVARTGLSRALSCALLYCVLLLLAVSSAMLVWPLVCEQLGLRAEKWPRDLVALQTWMAGTGNPLLLRLAARISPYLSSTEATVAPAQVSSALGVLLLLGRTGFGALLVMLFAFLWTLEGEDVVAHLLRRVQQQGRPRLRRLIEGAELRVGSYVRGQLTVCLISSTLLSLAFLIVGLPGALVLGLAAGGLEVVPLFGPLIAALSVALFAAAASPARAVVAVALVLGNHLLMSYLVAPRVIGRSVGVRPFVVLFSISAFGSLLGVAGAILAIPIAAILQGVLDVLCEPPPITDVQRRDRLGLLHLRAREMTNDVSHLLRDHVEAAADAAGDEAEDLTEALALELERILEAKDQSGDQSDDQTPDQNGDPARGDDRGPTRGTVERLPAAR